MESTVPYLESTDGLEQLDLFNGPAVARLRMPAAESPRSGREPAADRLRALAKPDMVRIAPGTHAWVPADATRGAPQFVLCRWTKCDEGAYRPIPVASRLARVTAELMACLGFTDGSKRKRYETLMRLGRAGFIDLVHASPGVWMLDLDSWFRHLAECAEDPEKWDEGGEDLETYLHANALGGWKRGAKAKGAKA